jgi:hydroxymethylglutaryl-CoA reductase (NADPH)
MKAGLKGGAVGAKIPFDRADNFSPEIVAKRQRFVARETGTEIKNIASYSLDPGLTRGNIENFIGMAQVPIGLAGPIKVNGEHANGEFFIPLATTEGTLVASYNRGMRVLNMVGGVTTTISDDRMQRAPVFEFKSAREAREFCRWIEENLGKIRAAAEATTNVGKLLDIYKLQALKFVYLRFSFSTGDAAGHNMVSLATAAACVLIAENNRTVLKWFLEANLASDKRPSPVNTLLTRGKRVTAEATIPREVLEDQLRTSPEMVHSCYVAGTLGSLLAGANNNGAQAVNALTALFVATGQDVACVAEGSSGVAFTEVTPDGGLYTCITMPALVVGTYGGGTSLPTQRECLEIMGCYGEGKVQKFAEIVAAVVLAGDISLLAAITSAEWVASHERYGRNR